MQVRSFVGAALILVVASVAWSLDLPEPPSNYTWREVPSIKAAFLVPAGWHVLEERDGDTLALFITPQAFTPPQRFEVGLSVNVFLKDPEAPNKLKQMLDRASAAHSVPLRQNSFGPFATLGCEYDSRREGDLEPVRTFNLGLANANTSTTYLFVFESPVSEWAAMWKLGKPIIDMLALESEL